jgi:aromatase
MSATKLQLSIALTAAAGIIIATIINKKIRKNCRYIADLQQQSQKDILQQILERTAPIAASEELAAEGGATCTRFLGGRQLVITADAEVANYVFNGPNKGNFIRRPAADEGLNELGMLRHGLIWNNDIPVWRKIRGCFQKSLGETTLRCAVEVAKDECQNLLHDGTLADVENNGEPMNLLDLARKVTLRATLNVFFGINSSDFGSTGIKEDALIDAIVSYFKAWEFFLFRPSHSWDDAAFEVHRAAVASLCQHVRLVLAATESPTYFGPRTMLFVDLLRQACHEQGVNQQTLLEHSALEMLLAGTDTSSVTAHYALLGLAGDCSLQQELRFDLTSREAKCQKKRTVLLDSVINETLRFKPVGPVVLRETVEADPAFPGGPIPQGAAVLVHLAEMNLREEYWQDPKIFNPKRFLDAKSSEKKVFFPFGEGPKGCIGMHLGRREVVAIVETVVSQYDMSIEGDETLTTLETHWDIANQPDKPTQIRVRRLRIV